MVDSTVLAAVIGAIATLVAAILPTLVAKKRRAKGVLHGTIDELLLSREKLSTRKTFQDLLPKAKMIRMCGWSMIGTINGNMQGLRAFTQRGGELRVVLIDPDSDAVKCLDNVQSSSNVLIRQAQNYPPVLPTGVTSGDIKKAIKNLMESCNVNPNSSNQILRVCNFILPIQMIIMECEDGSAWLSVQIYTLHPDLPHSDRLTFTLGDSKTILWNNLKSQFDIAWEDPQFSHPFKA